MQREYFISANTEQFVKELVDEILSELRGVGREHVVELVRPKKFVRGSYEHTRTEYGIGMAFGASTDLTDYSGDAEIFIHAESKVHQDRGISVIVKDWDGEKSKLTVSYRDAEDWELVKETWQLFEERIKHKGWNLSPKSTTAFAPAIVHDVRHLFEDSRGDSPRELIEGIKLLNGLGRERQSAAKEQSTVKEVQMPQRQKKATKTREIFHNEPITLLDILLRSVDDTGKRLGWDSKIERRTDAFCKVHVSLNDSTLLGTGLDLLFIVKSEKFVLLRYAENHASYLDVFGRRQAIFQECITFLTALESEGVKQLNLLTGKTQTNETWRYESSDTLTQGAWLLAAPKTDNATWQPKNGQSANSNTPTTAPAQAKSMVLNQSPKSKLDITSETTMDKIEFIYKGTPYELAQFAIEFGEREVEDNPLMWQNSVNGNPYATHPRVIHRDTNPIGIALVIDNPNPLFEGALNAQLFRASDDKVRTLVTGRIEFDGDEIDQMIAARYQRLYDELNRFGLIEIPTPNAAPARNGETRDEIIAPAPKEQTQTNLTPLQKKILQAVQELKGDYADPPDEMVASKVGLNPRGQPYTRETMNRERKKLRNMNFEV